MSKIIIKKPVSMLNKNLKLDFKKFFISSSKSAIGTTAQVTMGNPMAGSTIDQNTINKFENVTFKDTIVTGTLLVNEPEAITDEKGVVRLTKVFNP